MIQTGQQIDAADFVANPAPFFSIEYSAGVTHSLTTVANQRVLVIVKGNLDGTSNFATVSLKYGGVTKDSVNMRPSTSSHPMPFTLMYVEVPGAGTEDLDVETTIGTLANVKITVEKLLVG